MNLQHINCVDKVWKNKKKAIKRSGNCGYIKTKYKIQDNSYTFY